MTSTKSDKLPKVSIVIPVYNGSNYVSVAIDSALAQTYDNVEIIVVNDGSNDGGKTAEICKSYGDKIIYIEQENRGVGGAMNTAFEHLTGDYFCWLSHDDIHLPEKTSKQVAFLQSLPQDNLIAFGNYFLIKADGEVWHESNWDVEVLRRKPSLPLLRGWVNGCTMMAPTWLIRKHLPFREELRFTQDYDMWDRVRADGEFIFQQESLVQYRTHEGQDTHKPAAVVEGDDLWRRMIKGRSETERVFLEGSQYKFLKETADFLEGSPHKVVAAELREEMEGLKDKTLVSVIIPFKNNEDEAIQAIKSALNQTHDLIEVIAVDDVSTDKMPTLAALVEKTDNLKLIKNKKNVGPGAARNVGMEAAQGEYIAFLDSDDIFYSNKVAVQLVAMMSEGYLLSHTSYNVIFPPGRDGMGKINSGVQTGNIYPQVLQGCQISTPTVMLHRNLLKQGFSFPEKEAYCEDIMTWINIASRYPVLGIMEPLSLIKWRLDSAALNINKGLEGLNFLVRRLSQDPLHGRYTSQVSALKLAIDTLYRMRTFHMTDIQNNPDLFVLNKNTIDHAFGRDSKPVYKDTRNIREIGFNHNESGEIVLLTSQGS